MQPPLHIAIIADDLTGGADTGVQFCPAVGPVHLTSSIDGDLHRAEICHRGLSVNTNSRHLESGAAAARVRLAARKIHRLAPELIYKKIDSSLRGNLGGEIDALLLETKAAASFVAPAFPRQGRTTENDIHKIHGVPVADTEVGHDPLCPVEESQLSLLLSKQSNMTVGHVNLSFMEKGVASMAEKVLQLLGKGCHHIIFDVASDKHLDNIVALAYHHFDKKNILLVGSAGLAGSLAHFITARQKNKYPPLSRPHINKWLVVCGSASQLTADQTSRLALHTGWPQHIIDPSCLTTADLPPDDHHLVTDLLKAWADSSLILTLKSPQNTSKQRADPELVLAGLARVVAMLLGESTPEGLFLSGGDTAEAILQRIGAKGLCLHEEILPGLVRGEITMGPFNGLPVVTKAGSFGQPGILIQLINSLK